MLIKKGGNIVDLSLVTVNSNRTQTPAQGGLRMRQTFQTKQVKKPTISSLNSSNGLD